MSHSLPSRLSIGILASIVLTLPAMAQDRPSYDRSTRDRPPQEQPSEDRNSRVRGSQDRPGDRMGQGSTLTDTDHQIAQTLALNDQRGIEMTRVCAVQARHGDLVELCRDMATGMRQDAKRLAALTGDPRIDQVAEQAPDGTRSSSGSSGQDLSSVLSQAADALGIPAQGQGRRSKEPVPEGQQDQRRHQERMAELEETAGEDFDRLFLSEMLRHQRRGMRDIEDCQDQASNTDLRNLCGRMASSRQRDMDQLQEWQRRWFENDSLTSSRDR